jgi:hypothetical protein
VVTHARRRPKAHALRYRIFMLLLDLDETPRLLRALRLLTSGGFGLMSFRERDHGDRSGTPLRTQVERTLTQAGIAAGGAIQLLTMPRIMGHGFNPISVYFCHRPDGDLAAILYEVSNTCGERHSYLVAARPGDKVQRQAADKAFYVSPFMDMDLSYRFIVQAPGETVRVTIAVDDAEGEVLTAAFVGRRGEITDTRLLHAWLSHPLLTLKVVAGIHWEAARIFAKGVGFRTRPPLPARSVTLGRSVSPSEGARHAA